MSDTPRMNKARYDAPMLKMTQTLYEEGKKLERELNEANASKERILKRAESMRCALIQLIKERDEANADRHRLREALTQAGAGQFLDTISATPPPPVVAKADADAVAVALEMVRDADNDCRLDGFPTIPPAARFRIDNALETYRTKYP
jgi:hypothetical protein